MVETRAAEVTNRTKLWRRGHCLSTVWRRVQVSCSPVARAAQLETWLTNTRSPATVSPVWRTHALAPPHLRQTRLHRREGLPLELTGCEVTMRWLGANGTVVFKQYDRRIYIGGILGAKTVVDNLRSSDQAVTQATCLAIIYLRMIHWLLTLEMDHLISRIYNALWCWYVPRFSPPYQKKLCKYLISVKTNIYIWQMHATVNMHFSVTLYFH